MSLFRRELILAGLAGTVVSMGLGFIIPLFPIYVSQKGASNFELGLIVSGFTISQFLVQPFFGGLSDRHGRKVFMVGGLACYGLVTALYVLADDLPHVFLIRLLHGVGAGMIWPALSAFTIDQSALGRRGETMSLLSAVEMAGFAIGPLLGGMLYSRGGMALPFLGCSLLALVSMGIIWALVKEKPADHRAIQKSWKEQYGFSSLRLPDMRLLCLIGFSEAFVWGIIMTLLPVMASHLGVLPGKVGWLFSAYFIVYILLQGPIGKWSDRQGKKKPILLGMSIYTLAVLLLSQSQTFFHFLVILAIAGAGLGIYSPSVRVAIADLSSREVRGASMGLFFTARMLGLFLGPNIGGIMADRFGHGIPFLLGTGGLLVGIWASYSLSAGLSKSRHPEPARVVCPAGVGIKEMKPQ